MAGKVAAVRATEPDWVIRNVWILHEQGVPTDGLGFLGRKFAPTEQVRVSVQGDRVIFEGDMGRGPTRVELPVSFCALEYRR